jgi:hypothetical protein
VQTDIHGAWVYVRGPAPLAEEVFAFAQAIAELPGVERVILQSAPAGPNLPQPKR